MSPRQQGFLDLDVWLQSGGERLRVQWPFFLFKKD